MSNRVQFEVSGRKVGHILHGFLRVKGPKGSYLTQFQVDYRPIIREVAEAAHDLAASMTEVSGIESDRLYEIGFFSKLFRWVKKTVKKIANSKFIKGLVKAVKWVVNSPVVKGIVGIAKHIPFIGPIIHDVHKNISGVDKVVKRAIAGVPGAQKIVSAVAERAAGGNPTAINIARRMVEATKSLPIPVPQV